jgi:hypothetical protein
MKRSRTSGFVVIAAHWIIAVWHLFLAAKVLPVPDNNVSWLAISLLSLLHAGISIVWWKIPNRPAGLVLSIFFIATLASGIYEHFVHLGGNNVFRVVPGEWKTAFQVSVIFLVLLEVLGAWMGLRFLKSNSQVGRLTPAA